MAMNRKLQAEIDRVLKRVTEGIEEFGAIWQKVYEAATPNLKEKYEADLKKEIKKLQRYRDQIKSWASSSDVKNKKPLLDARKAIEIEMERFKVLEKETKTKAYSKEGLSQVAKNKPDPRKDPRYPTLRWISRVRRALKVQLEEFKQVLESAQDKSSGKGKGKKKSSGDVNVDQYNKWIERHVWHLTRLQEAKLRLKRTEIKIADVDEIKDDVDYYVESSQDPDFFADEYLYESLDDAAAAFAAEGGVAESISEDEEENTDEGSESSDDEAYEERVKSSPAPAPTPVKSAEKEKKADKAAAAKAAAEKQKQAALQAQQQQQQQRAAAAAAAAAAAPPPPPPPPPPPAAAAAAAALV